MRLRIKRLVSTAVRLSNGTTWPTLDHGDTSLEWRLRYGAPTRSDMLAAAEYVAAYGALVHKPAAEREAIVAALLGAEKRLRRARSGVVRE